MAFRPPESTTLTGKEAAWSSFKFTRWDVGLGETLLRGSSRQPQGFMVLISAAINILETRMCFTFHCISY